MNSLKVFSSSQFMVEANHAAVTVTAAAWFKPQKLCVCRKKLKKKNRTRVVDQKKQKKKKNEGKTNADSQ